MPFADTAATESLGVAAAKAATAKGASPSPVAKATAAKVGSAEAPAKSAKTPARLRGAVHQKQARPGEGDHQTDGFDSCMWCVHGFIFPGWL
jgi:hypothetical protein